ncbi:MAG: VRR-NUC domain-containing protein [Gammaproteobacteria bacterium]|nr:VRR-NUC domain-containing protein [Gammaproteobacteria bacterium]
MQKPNETSEVKVILDYLERFTKFVCWRQNQGAMKLDTRYIRFSYRDGISDIIGIAPDGRFVAIEVKRPGKKPTPTQAEFLEMIRRQGGIAIVATSLQSVIDQLGDIS